MKTRSGRSTDASVTDSVTFWLEKISKKDRLTAEEEYRLAKLKNTNEEARRILIKANHRRVAGIAKCYKSTPILDIDDFIQYGKIGLMAAVDNFDPEKGFRFGTYATSSIRQAISRAIEEKGRAIRIPSYLAPVCREILRIIANHNGQYLSIEEIATEIGRKPKIVGRAFGCLQDILSLDFVPEDNSASLHKKIADDVNVEKTVLDKIFMMYLESMMAKLLSKREHDIIARSLGLSGEEETLQEIADSQKVTRSRICGIRKNALRKLARSIDPP